jgi:hypothetical protein
MSSTCFAERMAIFNANLLLQGDCSCYSLWESHYDLSDVTGWVGACPFKNE